MFAFPQSERSRARGGRRMGRGEDHEPVRARSAFQSRPEPRALAGGAVIIRPALTRHDLAARRGQPPAIQFPGHDPPTCYGTEYVSGTLMTRAGKRGDRHSVHPAGQAPAERLCRMLQPRGASGMARPAHLRNRRGASMARHPVAPDTPQRTPKNGDRRGHPRHEAESHETGGMVPQTQPLENGRIAVEVASHELLPARAEKPASALNLSAPLYICRRVVG